jgi:RNA polymerase sigma factor (sigma-70 family)
MVSAQSPMSSPQVHKTIETVWRMESAKLVAVLTRLVHDVGLAEDLAQDALVIALEKWPGSGIPDNPAAWLLATARHRAMDMLRRRKMIDRKHDEIAPGLIDAQEDIVAALDESIDDDIGDDLLRLIFMTCHPALSTDARAALTLRLLGGLSTEEIARAFLAPAPTIAQRIVRARKTLRDEGVPFEVPRGEDREQRMGSVLEIIYLIFNEGYSATAGDDLLRPSLCEDALRLGRILGGLAPDDAEVHGLVALMEIQASRSRARTGRRGEPVLLLDQDRSRWDQLLIRRGLASLERAESLRDVRGPYVLQAAIAACHARARTAGETDWRRIADLYQELSAITGSPVVELNRAVAVSMADGPEPALAIVDRLASHPALTSYHLLPGVRGDLLARLGRSSEARREIERAASLTQNARERDLLLDRARSLEA